MLKEKKLSEKLHIEPKCFPFNKDGNNIQSEMKNGPAHTATGYLLPCCWMDKSYVVANDDDLNGVRVPELNLNTGISYKEIMASDNWKKFYKQLFEEPEKSHKICKECCGWITRDDGNIIEYWKK